MRLLLRTLSSLILVAALTAHIQAAGLRIDSPAADSTVGRSFTITGQATPNAALGVSIDGKSYLTRAARSGTPGEAVGAAQADAEGKFRVVIDLHGDRVVSDSTGPQVTTSGVPDGSYLFEIREYYYQGQAGTPGMTQVRVTVTSKESPTPQTEASASEEADDGQALAADSAATRSAKPVVALLAIAIVLIGLVAARQLRNGQR